MKLALLPNNVQRGLPEGHSALVYNESGTLPSGARLSPELANAFCLDALKLDDAREYGDFHEVHLGLKDDFAASFVIQDLFYLGETRSAEDFGIFHRMPPERLCLGCGVRSDETFSPLPPHDRSGLHKAAVRLMCLVLSEVPLPDETEDERLVKVALTPLVRNRDGHFLATLSALKLLLLEGKTQSVGSLVLEKLELLLPQSQA